MDGVYMDGVLVEPGQGLLTVRGCPISAAELKLFAFAKVSLTGQRSFPRAFYSI